uniref:ANK_REP_REGION domain-containing protein n=1 Tax=Elaeophora elaphi TaxID=1147741 RepID=A0A158Q8B3_9BILA
MEQLMQPAEYYAVHIPSPDDGIPCTGAVFATLREASSFANIPENKAKGARFKRFQNPDDAKDYAENGDMFCKSPQMSVKNQPIGEPGSSFPSVPRIMFNRLKKSIESKDDGTFLDMVLQNPRYLINIGSDTPTIVVEGFRYNAMHLAAKAGNLNVAKYILNFVCDNEALLRLYGTSEDDVRMRSRLLLDCYLNMPDKGSHDTPLHFASKFGHYHLVELFLSYNICQKTPLNKMGSTPAQICCTRYVGNDKGVVHDSILPLFVSFFVALYRPTDNYYSLTIQLFDEVPTNTLPNGVLGSSVCMSALEKCELAAYAGPFSDRDLAQKFYETWKTEEKGCRRLYPRKGAERVGRRLANEYQIIWMERWSFCNKLLDFQSCAGLEELNRFLVNIKLNPPPQSVRVLYPGHDDNCISFSDASDIVFDQNTSETSDSHSTSIDGITEKQFTAILIPEILKEIHVTFFHLQIYLLANLHLDSSSSSDVLLDSQGDNASKDDTVLLGNPLVTESMLCADSSVATSSAEHERTSNNENRTESFDFVYYTPPSSPEPIYVFEGIPSKDDEELANALSLVNPQLIQRFGTVADYVRHLNSVPESERSNWPYTDSPRAKKCRLSADSKHCGSDYKCLHVQENRKCFDM